MTEKEFKELKVGDKVRIISTPVSEIPPMGVLSMDKWSGKIMTIREIHISIVSSYARMREDETSNPLGGWFWSPEMIAEKVSDATRKIEPNTAYRTLTREDYDDLMKEAERQGYKWASGSNPANYNGFKYESKTVICFHNDKCRPKRMTYMNFDRCKGNKVPEWHVKKKSEVTIVMHLIKDGKTVIKLSDGRVGVAFCSPEDTFDEYEGVRLATARAYGKEPPAKKSKVKEVKRRAKVGEYIKIVNKSDSCVRYENGEIFKVECIMPLGSAVVYLENSYPMPMYDEEYVVLEGYKPKK